MLISVLTSYSEWCKAIAASSLLQSFLCRIGLHSATVRRQRKYRLLYKVTNSEFLKISSSTYILTSLTAENHLPLNGTRWSNEMNARATWKCFDALTEQNGMMWDILPLAEGGGWVDNAHDRSDTNEVWVHEFHSTGCKENGRIPSFVEVWISFDICLKSYFEKHFHKLVVQSMARLKDRASIPGCSINFYEGRLKSSWTSCNRGDDCYATL